MELYSCLELLLESSKSLETTLNYGSDMKHISLECSQRIIEDVSHHTALYCSKLLQVSDLICYGGQYSKCQRSFLLGQNIAILIRGKVST